MREKQKGDWNLDEQIHLCSRKKLLAKSWLSSLAGLLATAAVRMTTFLYACWLLQMDLTVKGR